MGVYLVYELGCFIDKFLICFFGCLVCSNGVVDGVYRLVSGVVRYGWFRVGSC